MNPYTAERRDVLEAREISQGQSLGEISRYFSIHSLGSVLTNNIPRDSIKKYWPDARDIIENILRIGV